MRRAPSSKATLTQPSVNSMIPAPALTVEALYADGSRKNVTAHADYFAVDPTILSVEQHGKGVVTGQTPGEGKIRVVYTDPNFKRGFEDIVTLTVKDSLKDAKLESVHLNCERIGRFSVEVPDNRQRRSLLRPHPQRPGRG